MTGVNHEVTPSSLAKLLNCSRYAAHRMMVDVERRQPGVVTRRGKGRTPVAIATELRKFIPKLPASALEMELKLVKGELREVTERLDFEVKTNLEFRRQSHQWFERVRKLELRSGR